MSYPVQPTPAPHLPGQNNVDVARQNDPRHDPRAYQYRPIMPDVRVEPPLHNAPTLGQYVRSDYRGVPGAKKHRWAGRLAFWLGLASAIIVWSGLFFDFPSRAEIGLAFSVVALFFGLVALIAGIGRGAGIWGIILALLGNAWVVAWLGENVF